MCFNFRMLRISFVHFFSFIRTNLRMSIDVYLFLGCEYRNVCIFIILLRMTCIFYKFDKRTGDWKAYIYFHVENIFLFTKKNLFSASFFSFSSDSFFFDVVHLLLLALLQSVSIAYYITFLLRKRWEKKKGQLWGLHNFIEARWIVVIH